jgi:hypothetical protein
MHILLVNLCKQVYEYVFNENSTFQMVGSTRSTPTVLTRRVVVIYHAATYDAGGDPHGRPDRSVAPDFADATANRATDAPETANRS